MSKSVNKLKMLPPNKTVVFWSPVEGEDVLVRTGTLGDGSCFFHSLLYAYSKEYVGLDKHGRVKFVKRLRASMAGKINRESWEEIGNGLIAKIPFQESVNSILEGFYNFIAEKPVRSNVKRNVRHVVQKLIGEDEKQLELYSLVTELIPFDTGFEQTILPEAYNNTENDKISITSHAIIERTREYVRHTEEFASIPAAKAKFISNLIQTWIEEIVQEAQAAAYNDYVKGLENMSEEIDSYTISLISDRFNRDVYFLDGNTRLPYNNAPTTHDLKKRKSMIVLYVDNCHYEIVGRLLPGQRVQREFDHDDPLIQRIYTFLVHPEKIADKYPDLVTYLPLNSRKGSDSKSKYPDEDTSESGGNESNSDSSESSSDDEYYSSSRHSDSE